MWSEIHRGENIDGKQISISNPPLHKRWVPEGYGPAISFPFTNPDEFISRHEAPPLREKFFHFSSEFVARLKVKANEESNTEIISFFQALSALVWRSIIRANHLPHNQQTNCRLAMSNRPRLHPPLPETYFGNSIHAMTAATTIGELLENYLGWAALMLNQSVADYIDDAVYGFLKGWLLSRSMPPFSTFINCNDVFIGSSTRFNMYGSEFGQGKALAVRSGSANTFGGKVSACLGYEGG